MKWPKADFVLSVFIQVDLFVHQPELLLLDEPSTGLDPAARSDLWQYLSRLRNEQGVTIVLTTHLLDEAEKAVWHRAYARAEAAGTLHMVRPLHCAIATRPEER